ncbi:MULTISPECIES: hypothetical protein [Thalassolituus]|uniref:hypothetical protein n=1 Tax=Thalassolituus TaxID=187492 RepID=UPI0023F46E72|nr:hypothetical protein [Thalassolituus oleivorans]
MAFDSKNHRQIILSSYIRKPSSPLATVRLITILFGIVRDLSVIDANADTCERLLNSSVKLKVAIIRIKRF